MSCVGLRRTSSTTAGPPSSRSWGVFQPSRHLISKLSFRLGQKQTFDPTTPEKSSERRGVLTRVWVGIDGARHMRLKVSARVVRDSLKHPLHKVRNRSTEIPIYGRREGSLVALPGLWTARRRREAPPAPGSLSRIRSLAQRCRTSCDPEPSP